MVLKPISASAVQLDFDHMHLLKNDFRHGALHVRLAADIADPYAVARGEQRPSATLTFKRSSGTNAEDLIGTELPPLRLVSSRTINLLRRERASGWDSYPVRILGKGGEALNGYELLVVTGRSGPIDNSKSVKVWKIPPPSGKPHEVWKGLYFDDESWDGSDVFSPGETTHVIVTDRIRQAFEDAKITNVSFSPLTEVERLTSEL